jgi:hypothetical protein
LSVPGFIVALVALLLGLLVPFLMLLGGRRGWLLPGVSLLAAAAFILFANFKPGHGADNPRANSISYVLNADTSEATWESSDREPDEWTSQFLREGPASNARTRANTLVGLAPAVDLRPAEVEVVGDEGDAGGGLRRTRLRVTPPRGARVLNLSLNQETEVVNAVVNGQRVNIGGDSSKGAGERGWYFSYMAPPPAGFDLLLEVRTSSPVTLAATSVSDGLPRVPGMTFQPRPSYLIPAQGSDTSRVTKKFSLGAGGGPESAVRAEQAQGNKPRVQ